MIMICSQCGGKHFHRKGLVNGIQQYKCVTESEDGMVCGCRKPPIFISEEEESDFVAIVDENIKLAKQKQRYQDFNRIERKSFRETTRVENAVIEYAQSIRDAIKENPINIDWKFPNIGYTGGSIGIVHLSDIHFNELVDVIGNKYDFKVASQRLKQFAKKIISGFSSRDISDVYIIMTGDLLNSDRRVDELLAMSTNRAHATFIAVKILSQFIIDIAMRYNVKVLSVTGNESRIREEYTQLDSMATDNFDFMIYEMLKLFLEGGHPRIDFISGNTFEYVLSVNNTNILIVHGHRLGKMTHGDLSRAIAKWSKKGMMISMIMCGHLHETNITDTLLRTGSLVGNNAYADSGLNLYSRASQNYYIIDENGNLDATRVDLQAIGHENDMYEIIDELNFYNAKSIDKLKDTKNILTIVT
jgi:predicted phosphodiesterase